MFFVKWQSAEEFFKLKIPHLCWEPQLLAYEASTLPQDQLRKSDWRVLKFVLNKACPIICNLAVSSEFRQSEIHMQ